MNELYDVDLERSLIGCVLFNSSIVSELTIRADDFHSDINRQIWQVIQSLAAENREIDIITIDQQMKRKEGYEFTYLSKCIDMVNFSHSGYEFARVLQDLAQRRAYVDIASRLATKAMDTQNKLNSEVSRIVDDLVVSTVPQNGSRPIRDFVQNVLLMALDRNANPTDCWGMRTGFVDFDNSTGGLQQGESMVLSGDSGVGKSMFACQLGLQLAENGYPGVIYSMEMKGESIVLRLISGLTRINSRQIKKGHTDQEQLGKVIELGERIARLSDTGKLFMSDAADKSILEIRADLAKRKKQNGIQWFVLDYMLLLKDAQRVNETEATTIVSRGIKNICHGLDLAGISIHSMNKSGMDDDGKPKKSSLRGSGQVIYDADLILLMTNDKFNSAGVKNFTFAKGRELEGNYSFNLVKLDNGKLPYFGNAARL